MQNIFYYILFLWLFNTRGNTRIDTTSTEYAPFTKNNNVFELVNFFVLWKFIFQVVLLLSRDSSSGSCRTKLMFCPPVQVSFHLFKFSEWVSDVRCPWLLPLKSVEQTTRGQFHQLTGPLLKGGSFQVFFEDILLNFFAVDRRTAHCRLNSEQSKYQ